MRTDPSVVLIGLGISYEHGCDKTSGLLGQMYPERVLDIPVSEGAVGGVCVGLAINKMRPVFVHGRVEFALFCIDSISTQSGKWFEQFGGLAGNCPVIFRVGIGRGWSQGFQHSASLYGLWGSLTGVRVVIPATPRMAKALLKQALKHDSPVVYLEPRWLYSITETVTEETEFLDDTVGVELDKARVVREGSDITLAGAGDAFLDIIRAADYLKKQGIDCEVIDIVSLNPVDIPTIEKSVNKTKKLLCVECGPERFGYSSEILSKCRGSDFSGSLTCPHEACPPIPNEYYPNWVTISDKVLEIFRKPETGITLSFEDLNLPPRAMV